MKLLDTKFENVDNNKIIVSCKNDSAWFGIFIRKPMHPHTYAHIRRFWFCAYGSGGYGNRTRVLHVSVIHYSKSPI